MSIFSKKDLHMVSEEFSKLMLGNGVISFAGWEDSQDLPIHTIHAMLVKSTYAEYSLH